MLAGGTDLISLMKDYLAHAQARGEHQEHQGARRHSEDRRRAAHRRAGHAGRTGEERRGASRVSRRSRPRRAASRARRSATWGRWAATSASAPAAGISGSGFGLLGHEGRQSLVPNGENQYHAIFGDGAGLLRQRLEPRSGAGRARRQGEAGLGQRAAARCRVEKFFVAPDRAIRRGKSRSSRTRS